MAAHFQQTSQQINWMDVSQYYALSSQHKTVPVTPCANQPAPSRIAVSRTTTTTPTTTSSTHQQRNTHLTFCTPSVPVTTTMITCSATSLSSTNVTNSLNQSISSTITSSTMMSSSIWTPPTTSMINHTPPTSTINHNPPTFAHGFQATPGLGLLQRAVEQHLQQREEEEARVQQHSQSYQGRNSTLTSYHFSPY